ncbi:uncharacterized protein TNIN_442382 [Trichonephila inaurata madagascariensis]|uniref:Uncharacterized protein n=1 Tax=Trichonephila inaurata madagascariensis TaxID=2747483 RepID=A0A8X6XXS8_9ARAC|nr:uncharacterized protein TNIN_442382 [Trichonephila inaurata madagascariensis]
MEGQRRCLGCKIVLAVLGVVSGASIFVSFIYYKNYNAAIWGLLTGYKIEDDGYAPAGIFALLSLKWTVMMFFEGRKYEKLLRSTGVEEAAPTSYNSVESGIVD